MFYFVGEPTTDFISTIESFLAEHVFPEAISLGDDHFNLELYPFENWNPHIPAIFNKFKINEGKRVPFTFREEDFQKYINESAAKELSQYQLEMIMKEQTLKDSSKVLKTEIEKFCPSLDQFFSKGLGVSVTFGEEIIGTCLSVYAYQNHYEIGINTYNTSHRGKGIATEMAKKFIMECLQRGYVPHWTTESFRVDSIKIAEKLGFTEHDHYTIYHFPIKE
jgi:RimJ/RimL family protein N-acetyltransferase